MKFVKYLDIIDNAFKEIPCIPGEGAPTTATEGAVGCLYMDTTSATKDIYKCVSVDSNGYYWTKLKESSGSESSSGTQADIYYYDTLTNAISDANNSIIGTNICEADNAAVSVYIVDGEPVITLLKDISISEKTPITVNMTLDINGKCLSFGSNAHLNPNNDGITVTINAEKIGSKFIKSVADSTFNEFLCVIGKGKAKVIGGTYEISAKSCSKAYVAAFVTNSDGTIEAINCKVNSSLSSGDATVCGIVLQSPNNIITNCDVSSTAGAVNGAGLNITVNGSVYAENSNFNGYGLGTKTYVGVGCLGKMELLNCNTYGLRAGVSYNGIECHINGGTHSGTTVCGVCVTVHPDTNASPECAYIENAILTAANVRGPKTLENYAKMSIGFLVDDNVSNSSIYLDNCLIKAGQQYAINMSGTGNKVCMTNCIIDKCVTCFATADEIANILGLTDAEKTALNEENGSKTLPRPIIKIADTTSKLILGQGNNFKPEHLLYQSGGAYSAISDVVNTSEQTFYVRDLIETATE